VSSPGTFGREHVALLTADEAAALDREAREHGAVPERVLMENAGRSAALVVQRLFATGRVIAVLGSGNNGGDALVMLRNLQAWGRDVAYLQAGSKPPDPALFHGFHIPRIEDDVNRAFAEAGVLIDGILGTGATGAPREPAAGVIRAMNASGRPIVALDIPTGVDPTTGTVPGDVVDAAVTVQFGWPKLGALQQPGRRHCGRIVAVEIAFPPLAAKQAGAAVITPAWAAARLPKRPQDAHKNVVGRLFVLAGHQGMSGAAVIAGRSAIRAGVGYTWIASPEANRTILQLGVSEAIFVDRGDETAMQEAASSADAVLAGPGIGTDPAAERALDVVLEASADTPCMLDADALNIFARRNGALRELASRRPLLITPHPGEMGRLTDQPVGDIQKDRLRAARAWVADHGATLLLKGAPSIVASPDAPVLVASTGSSDLASAGMGDMLSGTIGAFLAGGCSPRDAAGLGLFYGGRASELAGRHRGLSPNDVGDALHAAFADPGPSASSLDLPFVNFDQLPRW
jgi:ADP-dependent NAD(P)H-hydrate dehydratase / NAD(P)H-hydrate epimerase